MARYGQQTKARSLREERISAPESMPPAHRVCVVALLDACLHAGIGFYAGKWGRAGVVKFKFYTDDECLETFLDSRDNPEEWVRTTAPSLFSKGLVEELLQRVSHRPTELAPKAR